MKDLINFYFVFDWLITQPKKTKLKGFYQFLLCFWLGFIPLTTQQLLGGLELQEKEDEEKHKKKLIRKGPKVNGAYYLHIQIYLYHNSKVKHSADKEFQGLAIKTLIARLWNSSPAEYFPLSYDLNGFGWSSTLRREVFLKSFFPLTLRRKRLLTWTFLHSTFLVSDWWV